jgi:hypothetical protein
VLVASGHVKYTFRLILVIVFFMVYIKGGQLSQKLQEQVCGKIGDNLFYFCSFNHSTPSLYITVTSYKTLTCTCNCICIIFTQPYFTSERLAPRSSYSVHQNTVEYNPQPTAHAEFVTPTQSPADSDSAPVIVIDPVSVPADIPMATAVAVAKY